ncbi:MAG: Gfo/Idh/MocA family oxidoreductase [Burkholderiales bacterium]
MQRVVVIGAGWWGKELAQAAQQLPDKIEIRGCFTPNRDEAAQFAATFGGQAYVSYEAVLADSAVDGIVLATPHSTHAQLIVQAARARKHVFCEKPFTLTVASGREAIAECAAARVVLAVGHNRRFMAGARRIKSMVDAGELGRVIHVEANYSGSVEGRYPPGHWRVTQSELPAAGMTPMGLHMIDTLTWILGPIRRVVSITKHQVSSYPLDDTCAVLFELGSGATGLFASNISTTMTASLRLFGDKKSVDARDNFAELVTSPIGMQVKRTTDRFERDDSLALELAAFAAACEGGTPYLIKPAEALRNIAVLEAVVRSAQTNSWVEVSHE